MKVKDIYNICSGLAWGRNVNLLTDKFEVNAELPFPFFDGLQREMLEMASKHTDGIKGEDFVQSFKIIDLSFPNNVTVHIKQGDRVVFEAVEKKVDIGNGSYLRPGGGKL